jgi:protein SCO1/2
VAAAENAATGVIHSRSRAACGAGGADAEVRSGTWWTAGIFGLAVVALSACQPYQYKGTEYVDPRPAPEFSLARADGTQLRLADLRGQIVVLFFGFTSCPDVCPTTLSDARRILEGMGGAADRVSYLFITVDPERDTPEVVGNYVSAFHPAIIGLSDAPEALPPVWEAYGIYVEKVPLGDGHSYTVTHTARVFVIDDAGRLRLSYSYGTPYEDILQDLEHLLST